MKTTFYLLILCFFAPLVIKAQVTKTKKYSLFNPVPKDSLRGLETDRPDVTESPKTVDAGHFQIETDVFRTTRNKTNGIKTIENNYNLANLKLGLTANTDIQLIVASYVTTQEKSLTGIKQQNGGFGDLTIRLKQNLWGNAEDSKTALALLPYVTLPTGQQSDAIEGGITIPFSVHLSENYHLGTQAQIDVIKSDGKGYHASVLQSLALCRMLSTKLETFVEGFYNYDLQTKKFDFSVNGGASYLVTENLKFDAGINIGLTKNTDKVYFIGFSFRY